MCEGLLCYDGQYYVMAWTVFNYVDSMMYSYKYLQNYHIRLNFFANLLGLAVLDSVCIISRLCIV